MNTRSQRKRVVATDSTLAHESTPKRFNSTEISVVNNKRTRTMDDTESPVFTRSQKRVRLDNKRKRLAADDVPTTRAQKRLKRDKKRKAVVDDDAECTESLAVSARAVKRAKTKASSSHAGVGVVLQNNSTSSGNDNEQHVTQLMDLADDVLGVIFRGVDERGQQSLMATCRESRRVMRMVGPVVTLRRSFVLSADRRSVSAAAEEAIRCLSSNGWRVRVIADSSLLTDVSALSQAYEIDLSHCLSNYKRKICLTDFGDMVVDVSPLAGVTKLNLQRCQRMVGWETLGGVRELNLSRTRVDDARPFARVTTLDLSYTGVRDVSPLCSVHTLRLQGLDAAVDVSCLGQVRVLDLSDSRITDVSGLGGVRSLDLSRCKKLKDVSALGSVHHLNLQKTNVVNVSSLGGVHTLNLQGTPVTDVSSLGGDHTLKVSWCW
eukprot:GFYU01016860.1.p1 GENE.GFYU01016860.1~~GFYU01016860.1.p1  ORF type:complete len:434 (-),score=93.06 GFYU01016860.1:13-1314(-)